MEPRSETRSQARESLSGWPWPGSSPPGQDVPPEALPGCGGRGRTSLQGAWRPLFLAQHPCVWVGSELGSQEPQPGSSRPSGLCLGPFPAAPSQALEASPAASLLLVEAAGRPLRVACAFGCSHTWTGPGLGRLCSVAATCRGPAALPAGQRRRPSGGALWRLLRATGSVNGASLQGDPVALAVLACSSAPEPALLESAPSPRTVLTFTQQSRWARCLPARSPMPQHLQPGVRACAGLALGCHRLFSAGSEGLVSRRPEQALHLVRDRRGTSRAWTPPWTR